METSHYTTIVSFCWLMIVCNASVASGSQASVTSSNEGVLEQSAIHVLKTRDHDNHVNKRVDEYKHIDKNVDQANHMLPRAHLSRLIAESLNVVAPVSPTVENDLCRKHSLWFQDGVINNKLWALKMLDASSKQQSGLLMGNVIELGNYEECLSVEDVESKFGRFSGQHCMVAIGKRTFANEIDIAERIKLGFETQTFTDEDLKEEGVEGLLSKLSVLWSVCVPSSCRPSDVEQHLRSALRTSLGNISITVQDGACSSRANRKPLRTIDWGFIVLLMCIGVLVILSSVYDLTTRQSSSRRELLLAFSLPLHWSRFLRVGVDDIPVINGVKAISMIHIVVGHVASMIALYPAINFSSLGQFQTQPGYLDTFIANANLAVDTFLLISGMLMCLNFLKDREKEVEFSLPRYFFHRYIRIVPLFALLQMLMATLITADGVFEGPLWGPNALVIRSTCENWFHTQLFVNNFLREEEMCLGHTWYLSLDMQLFLISSLILFPLWRKPQFGKSLLFILASVGTAISVGAAYAISTHIDFSLDNRKLDSLLYFPPHMRFTPWIIGIGLGYALHVTKRVSPRLARSTVTLGWILCVTLMLTSLFLRRHFLQRDYKDDGLSVWLYVGLKRPAWALGLAWFVFAMSRGYGATCVLDFFSNRIFQLLGRLSYSIFHVHVFVILGVFAIVKTPIHLSAATFVIKVCSEFSITVAIGLVLHLLVEAPPIYIERAMFTKVKKNQKEQ